MSLGTWNTEGQGEWNDGVEVFFITPSGVTNSISVSSPNIAQAFESVTPNEVNTTNILESSPIIVNHRLDLNNIKNASLLDQTLIDLYYALSPNEVRANQAVTTVVITRGKTTLGVSNLLSSVILSSPLLIIIPEIGDYRVSFSKTIGSDILDVNLTKIEYGE
jgi:hypothetical protein